jgi:short-subunit dehydrogenase
VADLVTTYPGLALVTGASSGVGAATALCLAREGVPVVLVARRHHRLQELQAEIAAQGGRAYAIAADLSQSAERRRVVATVHRTAGPVSILVNNAGIGWYGFFADMQSDDITDIVAVNLSAIVHLTSLVLPEMLRAERGAVVNVGSVSSNLAAPGNVIYGATKTFVAMFSNGLYRELRHTGVRVGVVHSGPVRTDFYATAAARSGHRPPGERFAVKADHVAAAVVGLLRRPRRQVYVPAWMRMSAGMETWAGWLLDRVGARLLG